MCPFSDVHRHQSCGVPPLTFSPRPCWQEAAGNGDVVRLLVQAGADINHPCWDITPLCAAANAGHHWAVEELLQLGADPNVWNGYMMAAMDYCRDVCTVCNVCNDGLLPRRM